PMPDADRVRFAGNIARETQRIQELVDRMMELTALESRRSLVHTERVSLRPLLEELAASAGAAGAARGVQVVLLPGEAVQVEGDALLLRRAMGSLVDNALDFSPAGGTVQLAAVPRGQHLDVSVRDHGPGVPEYAEEKVFEKFYSLARPHGAKRSTGLGLSFAR